jgi:hypothetical protein
MLHTNLARVRSTIQEVAEKCRRDPSTIKLVAVSKRFPVEVMLEALAAGQTLFGENYIQEAIQKKAALVNAGEPAGGAKIHFIGHLQSNKARSAVETCDMIETVDRRKIASELNKHLERAGRTMDILVQVNIGRDSNKSGVLPEHIEELILHIRQLSQLKLKGLMTMPPFTEEAEKARPFFKQLRNLSLQLQEKGLLDPDQPTELSMGMSHDFHIAIEEGATLIRVGTAIFGHRPVQNI